MRIIPLATATMLLASGAAQAQSIDGTIIGGPEWVRPFQSGSCCSTLGPVQYSTQAFGVNTAGSYTLESVQTYDGYVFVYFDSFDPNNQTSNFLDGDDDGTGGIGTSTLTGMNLAPGQTYIIVTTAFSKDDEGTFTTTISGPGLAYFGNAELAQLVAALGVTGRVVVAGARNSTRSGGQGSFVSRSAHPPIERVLNPDHGAATVTRSTQNAPGMMGNVYTWVELTGFSAEDDTAGRDYAGHGVQIGADIAVSPTMVAGLSIGIQDLDATANGFSQSGALRFIQPYLAYKSGPWSADATLMYGQGDYTQTSIGGTGTGESQLLALSLNGGYEIALEGTTTITPMIGLAYGQERVDGVSGTLAGAGTQTVRFMEASLGAELRQTFSGGEAFAGVHADWLDTSSESTLVSDLLVDDGWTGRVAFGVSTELDNGLLLDTSLELSGLGGDLSETSGALRLAFRF